MYYTKNTLFSTPGVPAISPQQKFILIEQYLHFVENTTLTPEHSRRAKIAPIFDYLVDTFRCNYNQNKMFPLTKLYYCRNDAYPGNNIYHVNALVSDWNHLHLLKLSSVTHGIQYCTLVMTLAVLTDVSFNAMQRKIYFHLPNTYWIRVIAFMLIISTLLLNYVLIYAL